VFVACDPIDDPSISSADIVLCSGSIADGRGAGVSIVSDERLNRRAVQSLLPVLENSSIGTDRHMLLLINNDVNNSGWLSIFNDGLPGA
jgi:hypothetical protein